MIENVQVIGREREMADLGRLIRGSGMGVVLFGDRGVGKTTVMDALLALVAEQTVVSRVTGNAASQSIPFGALAPLLGPLPSSPLSTVQILGMALDAVRQHAAGERLVIGVDDVHLVDDASITVIDQLARQEDVVLVTTQPTEVPLADWLQQLIQADSVRRIDIHPLDRERCALLVASVLAGAVDEALDADLWRLTAGNPLMVRQLLATAVESEALVMRNSAWIGERQLVATGHLAEILDARLAARDPEELAVLELVAVGGLVELAMVESLFDTSTVESLEASELLSVDSDNHRLTVQLRHPLLSERIEHSMPVTRRRRISRTLADWVASTGARRRGDALRVATWDLATGTTIRPEFAIAGAEQALGGSNAELAERLCQIAFTADDGFLAQITMGLALHDQGREIESEDAFLRAERAASGDAELARLATVRTGVMALTRADPVGAVEFATEASASITEPDAADALAAEIARLALVAGDPNEAVRMARKISARPDASSTTIVLGLVASAPALVMLGRFGAAIEDADRGCDLIDGGADDSMFARDRLGLARSQALSWAGRLTDAIDSAEAAYRAAGEASFALPTALWQAQHANAVMLTGDVARSRALVDNAVADLSRHDRLSRLSMIRAGQAMGAAEAGDVEALSQALDAVDTAFVEAEFRTAFMVDRASAWRTALEGDTEAAARDALKNALAAIDNHNFASAALALHDGVRFGHADVVLGDIEELAPRFEGELFPAFAQHARALDRRSGPAMDAVAETYADLSANLLAAEASAQAAHAHREMGEETAARRSETRTEALLALCPGADTPAIRRRQTLLTTRQTQIGRLALQHTNAEIASRLSISVRTVENHLATVYFMLDVHSRSELAAIFGSTPADDT